MKIRTIPRDRKDRLICTVFKKDRKRIRNFAKGDLILFKINQTLLIRKVKEDFMISLPKNLNLKPNIPARIQLLRHIKPEEGLERPKEGIIGNLIDLRHFIPTKTIHGFEIFVIDDDDKIFAWFPVRGGVKHIHIKRFANLEMLFEIIGFWWGDGSTEGIRNIRFTNCEPSTLVHVIKLFESIGISRNVWKVQIIWSGPKEPSVKTKEKCKEFWSKNLDIPINNVKSVLWSKGKFNKVRFGSARIFIDNAILFEIFKSILEWSKEEIKNTSANLDILKALLRGITAAEATPFFFNDVIRGVEFSFDPSSEELDLFRLLLKKLDIVCLKPDLKGRKCRFNVEGWNNLLKLFILDAFKLHKTKNGKFVKGFMRHKSTFFRLRIIKQIRENNLNGIRRETLKRFKRDKLINIENEKVVLTNLGKSFISKC